MSHLLHKSDELVDCLMSATEDAIVIVGAEGCVEAWNPAAERLFGYPAIEIIGRPVSVMIPEPLLPRWHSRLAALRVERTFRGRSVRRHRNGSLVDVHVSARAMHNQEGRFRGYVLVYQDQALRDRAERNNELLAAIVNASPMAIVSAALDFKVLTWNAAAERLFGYAADEMIGGDLRMLLPPRDSAHAAMFAEKMQANTTYRYEATRLHKLGHEIPVSAVASPQSNAAGIITAWAIQYTDLTRSKETEQALRSTTAFARTVVEGSPDWISIIGADDRIAYSNKSECGAGDVVLEGADWLQLWHLQSREALQAALVEARVHDHARVKALRRASNGAETWYDLSIARAPVTPGTNDGLIVTARDATAEVRWEAHNIIVMRELSHRAKNLLAVVNAMVRSTAGYSTTIRHFEAALTDRLRGLAKCHDLLVQKNWKGVPLDALVKDQIGLFLSPSSAQLDLDVGNVMLGPAAGQCLSMALHELATNSAKYGALSVPGGKLRVQAARLSQGYAIDWIESGGPPVRPPAHRGFGTEVIETLVSETFDCDARMVFDPQGMRWSAQIPHYLAVDAPGV